MEDNQNISTLIPDTDMLSFDAPKDQSSYIKVIGVGGGGGNAVNHMYRNGIKGVDFIVCNTDMQALNDSPVPNKIMLGKLGAGGRPEVARNAALSCQDEIKEALSHNTQMLFITAGMGGGTGTGAAPVIAEIAKSIDLDDPDIKKILVIGIVTMPFTFEGLKKMRIAESGLTELRKHVDSLLIINNDKLMTVGGDLPLMAAFNLADDVLLTAAKGIAEIITDSAYVNIDFHDVYTVMKDSGTALMGSGIGAGEYRAIEAIEHAANSVLLNDNNIEGAKSVLLYITCSSKHPVLMSELGTITDCITNLTNNQEAEVFWGTGTDDNLNDEICITLIATGFEKKIQTASIKGSTVIGLEDFERNVKNQRENAAAIAQPAAPVTEDYRERPSMDPIIPAVEVVDRVIDEVEQCTEEVKNEGKHIFVLDENCDIVEDAPVDQVDNQIEEDSEPIAEVADEPMPEPIAEPVMEESVEEPVMLEKPAAIEQEETPVAEVPAPAPEPKKIVIPLDEKTAPVKENTYQPTFDFMDALKAQQQPKAVSEMPVATIAQPVRQTQTPRNSNAVNDTAVMNRQERIKRMHDMLRNNPNGARLAEDMTPKEMADIDVYETPHSSESDAARTTINHDGSVNRPNNYLFGYNPD